MVATYDGSSSRVNNLQCFRPYHGMIRGDRGAEQLTPKDMMQRNILKNVRKMTLLANARGTIPMKVVAVPTRIDGPISPRASAILLSLGAFGS